jgi:hypothetical protein
MCEAVAIYGLIMGIVISGSISVRTQNTVFFYIGFY